MNRWWGECTLAPETQRLLVLGPGRTTVRRTHRSWWIHHRQEGEPRAEDFGDEVQPLAEDDDVGGEVDHRVVAEEAIEALEFVPRTPDRPLVLALEHATLLPAGEQVTVWVAIPLWIGVRARDSTGWLLDFPVWRPSDTFVGLPVAGELAYAARTRALRTADPANRRAQRATARVTLRNRSGDTLELKSLSIPVPRLSLFVDEDNWLATETVLVTQRGDGDPAEVELGQEPPSELGPWTRVQEPRVRHTGRFHARVLANLFG